MSTPDTYKGVLFSTNDGTTKGKQAYIIKKLIDKVKERKLSEK